MIKRSEKRFGANYLWVDDRRRSIDRIEARDSSGDFWLERPKRLTASVFMQRPHPLFMQTARQTKPVACSTPNGCRAASKNAGWHDVCNSFVTALASDRRVPTCLPEETEMNAIELLKADHERVKSILSQLSESTERGLKKRTDLLAKLEMEITIHTKLEEEILYPAFKVAGAKEQDIMYYEAKEEHRTVDSLVLPDLKETDPGTPEFSGRVKVVKELLEHHIEEEESEMFPQAQKLLGKAKLDELGAQMEALKADYKKSLSSMAA
jgi:hemerythrin superfamily protein